MSDQHMSLETYRSLPDAQFPLSIGKGKVHSLDLVSDCCDHVIMHPRITVTMILKNTAQLNIGGHCGSCGAYESGKLRWYLEENNIDDFRDGGKAKIELTPRRPIDKVKYMGQCIKKVIKKTLKN